MVKITVDAIKHPYKGEVRIYYGGSYDGISLTEFITPEIENEVNERVNKIIAKQGYYDDGTDDIEVKIDVTVEMLLKILLDHEQRLNTLEDKHESMDGY